MRSLPRPGWNDDEKLGGRRGLIINGYREKGIEEKP